MPEVAEIALTAEILNKYFRGKILISFDFVSGRYTRRDPVGYHDFSDDLPLKIVEIDSRGKFMWFDLVDKYGNHWYIWNTFGLTGMWSRKESKYVRAVLTFKNDKVVYFMDMRNFGTFKFSTNKEDLDNKLLKLSPDFLKDDDFDLDSIRKYKIPIVKILMDQKKIGSGLGNYLVAEILYRAKLSPHRLGVNLTNQDIENLTYWIKYVVKLSYMDNNIGYMTNLKDEARKLKKRNYHPDIELRDDTFGFLVYRQKEDPYGNPVKGEKINSGRTTYWVPAVQI